MLEPRQETLLVFNSHKKVSQLGVLGSYVDVIIGLKGARMLLESRILAGGWGEQAPPDHHVGAFQVLLDAGQGKGISGFFQTNISIEWLLKTIWGSKSPE